MALMALDHASYFIAKVHRGEFWGLPLPVFQNTPAFLTRFVTHFCAPGFFFLMGAGITMFAASRRRSEWSEKRIIRFFIVRGLILVLIQLSVENIAWLLGALSGPVEMGPVPGGGGMIILHFGVLYALGASMIVCSIVIRFRPHILALLGLAAVLATQILTPSIENVHTLYSPLLRLLLIPGRSGMWQSYYPLVPWIGLCWLGMAFGKKLLDDRRRTFDVAFFSGVVFLILFIALRIADGFGNLHHRGPGWIPFLNLTKYPPSLTFVLLTIGLDLLLLVLFEKTEWPLSKLSKPFLVYGRAPLFFYITHLYIFAAMDFIIPGNTSIPMMYPFWFLGLVLLYPVCKWYGSFKSRTAPTSVWRLF